MPQNNFPWTGDQAPSWGDIKDKPTTFAPVPATTAVVGGVKAATVQANSVAADVPALVVDFNALLAKLKVSGAMASS